MISTFYSYKGGVGRSMALANVANAFAQRGLRTVMIDFDLEAPGIERFFLSDPSPVRRNPGLLELLLAYKEAMSEAPGEGEAKFRKLGNFLVPIYHQLPSGGTLDLLPAGQRGDDEQLATYAFHLRTFDWQEFYFEWMGELFFQWLRRELLNRYDTILVDSRTGMTEMGGVCAYQLADHLVMFCAANSQNVQGTRDIIRNFQSPRVLALRKERPLSVMVVPARVQQNSDDVERFRTEFERSFAPFTPAPLTAAGRTMWDLMLPYEAAYAFEERVADGGALKTAFERLADTLALLAPEGSRLHALARGGKSDLQPVEAAFDPTRRFAGYDAFLSYNRVDQESALRIAMALRKRGLAIWLDLWDLTPGAPLRAALERALDQSRAFVILIGPSEAGVWRKEEERMIIERSLTARDDFRLIPVLLPGSSVESIPTVLRPYSLLDLRTSIADEEALDALAAGIQGQAPGPRRAVQEDLNPFKGLDCYREQDAPLFFGRQGEVDMALAILRERNLLAVVGPAGSGKTSLVHAGIIPRLRKEIDGLKVLPVRPADDPIRSLAAALAPIADLERREIERMLLQNPRVLGTLIGQHISHPVLLVIDQLEELWSIAESAKVRSAFLQAIRAATGACRVILVLRTDDGAAAMETGLQDLFSGGLVHLGQPSRDALREMIESPARLAGLAFEPGLVERLVDDAKDAVSPLPLLQVVLGHLWARRRQGFMTHADYQQIGGIRTMLARSADETYASLTPQLQVSARSLLLRMVGPDGSRQLTPIAELGPQEREVLDRLVHASLVVIDRAGSTSVATLAHDALVRHWPLLRAWMDESREQLMPRLNIEIAAMEWESNGHASEYLYRGRVLEKAKDLAGSHPEMLSALARRFLQASREKEESWIERFWRRLLRR